VTSDQSEQQERISTADMAEAAPVQRRAEDQPTPTPDGQSTALFPGTEAQGFRQRWDGIQGQFVDEPRRAVEQADSLVAEVMQRLAQVFAEERQKLEQQWEHGDAETEELRQALRRYRSFFDRLLTM
jgi:hypothetical protein